MVELSGHDWIGGAASRHREHIEGLWLRGGRVEVWQELKGGVVLGGEDFVKRVVRKPSLEEPFAGVKDTTLR